jgi:hypothetical protein
MSDTRSVKISTVVQARPEFQAAKDNKDAGWGDHLSTGHKRGKAVIEVLASALRYVWCMREQRIMRMFRLMNGGEIRPECGRSLND